MCILSVYTLAKVVAYDLSVLSMSVMGFQKKSLHGGWWVGWALQFCFGFFFTLQIPLRWPEDIKRHTMKPEKEHEDWSTSEQSFMFYNHTDGFVISEEAKFSVLDIEICYGADLNQLGLTVSYFCTADRVARHSNAVDARGRACPAECSGRQKGHGDSQSEIPRPSQYSHRYYDHRTHEDRPNEIWDSRNDSRSSEGYLRWIGKVWPCLVNCDLVSFVIYAVR